MDILVSCKEYSGSVRAISSKSDVHRALICAALADKESTVRFNAVSQDIMATVNCLNALGADIRLFGEGAEVVPIRSVTKNAVLDCGESGSTLRFMLPVAAALGADASFTGRGRLFERPLEPLTSLMQSHGVQIKKDGEFPLEISGKMSGGDFCISGSVSSQFITGLLFALPLCGGGAVDVIPPVESAKYIDMTVHTMKRYGIEISQDGNVYRVDGKDYRVLSSEYIADGDWSNAAFFLCAGAINGRVKVTGLNINSLQGDKKIAEILKSFGADVSFESDGVTVKSSSLKGIRVDASQIPDLVPIIAVTAAFADGTTEIYNASRLRIKESDRLFAVRSVLNSVGALVTELDDGLLIKGRPSASYSGSADSFNDHRIAMSLAVAGANSGSIKISRAEAVNKSYPSFYEDFKTLGGKCDVL